MLTEGVLCLFDGSTGDLRTTIEAPCARQVRGDGHGFWLDEGGSARHLSRDGRERGRVELRGAVGLLDADGRRVERVCPVPSDYSNLRVLSLSGGVVAETPRDMMLASVALVDTGVVVADQKGINFWPFDADQRAAQAPVRPAIDIPVVRSQALRVVTSRDGWFEVWLDVVSEEYRPTGPLSDGFQPVDVIRSARSRLERVVSGEVVASRVFEVQLLEIQVVGDLAFVLFSSQGAAGSARAKDVEVVVVDGNLATVASFPMPTGQWSGGFAVC